MRVTAKAVNIKPCEALSDNEASAKEKIMSTNAKNKKMVLTMAQLAVFTAIEIIFAFTPLGSLPIGPGIVATLAHIPVLVVAVSLGKWAALYMGGVMAVCAEIWWNTVGIAYPTAFVFTPFAPNGTFMSAVICIVPRVIFPFLAALIFSVLKKKMKIVPAAAITGVAGSLIHSCLVLGLIYVSFYGNSVLGENFIAFIIAWAGLNAVMEIIVAGIVCAALAVPLNKVNKLAAA